MNTDITRVLIILGIVVGSVILHELAHGVVAYWLGDDTAKRSGRLTLNPLKHIDPYMSILIPMVLYLMRAPVFGGAKPVPVNYQNLKWREWGMALVAVAGPLTNFLLAFVMFLIGHFTGYLYQGGLGGFFFAEAVIINLGFMIFNLIPIPPLDGSRILYAVSPDVVRGFLVKMERYGVIVVYLLIFLFGDLFSGIMVSGMQGIMSLFNMLVGN